MSFAELVAGQRLGRFELVRRLAMGGMAEVWLADEHVDGGSRAVALKILLSSFASDPAFRSMFMDEVHIASLLAHQNIVTVYGGFELEGRLVQAMEVLEGKDLRRLLSMLGRVGARLPVGFALLIAEKLAAALAYAHARRGPDGRALEIVHRDVSPHNLFITRDGRVKLLDFGIASAADRLTRTRTGVVKGKLSYMAPEQALGVGVSPRTDVFASGVVLWEMLAMKRLFRGESDAETLERVIEARVPSVRGENPAVPEAVESLLGRLLAARATDRPASMAEVEASLRAARAELAEATTVEAFGAWLAPWLDTEPRKTGRFPAARPAPEQPPVERRVEDATLAGGAPPPLESGAAPPLEATRTLAEPRATPARETERDTLPVESSHLPSTTRSGEASDATERRPFEVEPSAPFALGGSASFEPGGSAPVERTPSDGLTQPLSVKRAARGTEDGARLPTRSEIQRAVDAVTTQPLAIDPRVRASGLSPPSPTSWREVPGPSRGPVDGPEVPSTAPRSAQGPVSEAASAPRGSSGGIAPGDPTVPGLAPWPVVEGPPAHPRALERPRGLEGLADEVPPPVASRTPRWVYPTIVTCLVVIVFLLMLLIMKGK